MLAFLATPLGKTLFKIVGVLLALAFLYFCFKLWVTIHDKQVLSGYVLLTEKTAADARVAGLQKQIQIQQKAYEETRKRQMADDLVLQAKDAENDKDIAEYEQKLKDALDDKGKPVDKRCLADDDDAKFLSKH